jgi:hypothetical protein
MQTVSRFEANLLRLLAYFLRREPIERAMPLLKNRCQAPPCLSRGAVELVQDALAKGCVHLLAKRGGWQNERFLRNGQVVEGRLWQRTLPQELGLSFSGQALEFLIWITCAQPGDTDPAWTPDEARLTLGDQLLLFFVQESLRGKWEGPGLLKLWKTSPFLKHGLCWLAYPQDFATLAATGEPHFDIWVSGTGACVMEALQAELAERWVRVEGEKERQASGPFMRQLGNAQRLALAGFLDAIEAAGRFDLARFVLRAARKLVAPYAHAGMWIGALQTGGMRLTDRTAVYESAMVFLHQLLRLRTWALRARTVHYFDEGYQSAKLFLADWEYYEGQLLCERAHTIIRQMDPLRNAGAN